MHFLLEEEKLLGDRIQTQKYWASLKDPCYSDPKFQGPVTSSMPAGRGFSQSFVVTADSRIDTFLRCICVIAGVYVILPGAGK